MNGYMLICKKLKVKKWFAYASQADLHMARLEKEHGDQAYTIKPATKQERLERQGGGNSVHGSYHN